MKDDMYNLLEELNIQLDSFYYEDRNMLCAHVLYFLMGYISSGGIVTNELIVETIEKYVDKRRSLEC